MSLNKLRVVWMSLLAIGMCLLVVDLAAAQPPGRDTGPKASPPDKGPADPTVEAWVQVLVQRMTDRHDLVRDSAREALVAIGKPALPALHKLARGEDAAAAYAAKKLIARIENSGPFGREHPGPAALLGGKFQGLELSEKQRGQVEEIGQAHQKKVRDLMHQMRDAELQLEHLRSAPAEMHEEMLKALRGVLSEEQYKRFVRGIEGGSDQPATPQRPPVDDRFAKAGLKIGEPVPDVTAYDPLGKEFKLRSLRGHYSVLVFGCLT